MKRPCLDLNKIHEATKLFVEKIKELAKNKFDKKNLDRSRDFFAGDCFLVMFMEKISCEYSFMKIHVNFSSDFSSGFLKYQLIANGNVKFKNINRNS